MIPTTCSVTHVVFVPLGGLETAGLIRDLYDLDCWLRKSGSGSGPSLPETRRKLWQLLTESNNGSATGTDRTLFMPESLSASNKIRTYSAPPDPDLPAKIAPLSPEDEIVIISFLMKEINENYALQLCEFPSMARCSETEELPVDTGRIFAIGGSHVKRMVGGLVNGNHEVINLSKSGWKADPAAVSEITAKLKTYNLCAADTVVIDPISNSVFCGTDEAGNLVDPIKDAEGKWHIPGEMAGRPKTVLKRILGNCSSMFEPDLKPKLVILVPIPHCVTGKCCDSAQHITNIADPEYIAEMDATIEMLEDLLTAWGQSVMDRADIFHFRTVTDDPDDATVSLMVRGETIWSTDDPVHANPVLYKALAADILNLIGVSDAACADVGAGAGPPAKRARLESVVVQRESSVAPKVPTRSTASWLTGTLPPTRGRGGRERGGSGQGPPFRGRGWGRARPYYRGWSRY
jgi:hypothetical protein